MNDAWRPPNLLIALDASTEGLEPAASARAVARALAAEPGGVLLRPSARGRAIIAALAAVPVVAVLPDMPRLLRDVSEHGPVRAALGRLGAGGLAAWWRLGMTSIRHVGAIARQDFRGLLPVLIELERAGTGPATPQGVALAAPLTDLLLAAGHADGLAHVTSFLRERVGTRAGFETMNLGHLLPRLAAWGVQPDFVVGPMNARGFCMKPSADAVLDAVRRSGVPVLASEVSARGTIPVGDAVAYVRRSGAAGVILGLDEVDYRDGTTLPSG